MSVKRYTWKKPPPRVRPYSNGKFVPVHDAAGFEAVDKSQNWIAAGEEIRYRMAAMGPWHVCGWPIVYVPSKGKKK